MAIISGTAGNDSITGTADADEIRAGEGGDTVRPGSGDDIVYGEGGRDNINGELGNDIIYGGAEVDILNGHSGSDTIYGGTGNDGIWGGGDNDWLFGESGDDGIAGDGGNDLLDGGFGNDILYGGTGNDTIVVRAGEGFETINGGSGIDTVHLAMTGAGVTTEFRADVANYLSWMNGLLATHGSTGQLSVLTAGDTVIFSSMGFSLSLVEGLTVTVDGTPVALETFLNSSPQADRLATFATTEDTSIGGMVEALDADGDDLMWSVSASAASGTVAVDAATGAYIYTPNADFSGNDAFEITVTDPSGATAMQRIEVAIGAVADAAALAVAHALNVVAAAADGNGTTLGGSGNDSLTGGQGADRIAGNNGNDVIYGDTGASVSVPLSITSSLVDIDGSEHISIVIAGVPAGGTLSAGQDNGNGQWTLGAQHLAGLTLTLSSAADVALSVTATTTELGGDQAVVADTLAITFDHSGDGADTLVGGNGNDILHGGGGDDLIYGGNQRVSWAPDVSTTSAGDHDVVHAGDGNDTVYGGSGNDSLTGEAGNDRLYGGKGDDQLSGGDGNDTLNGESGSDIIEGGAGNDTLSGSSGNDAMSGGDGNDRLDGGSGNDVFTAGLGNDQYIGGTGFDTLDFSAASAAISVDASKKTIGGFGADTMSGIERVIGSDLADVFKGSSGADNYAGGDGDDAFRGMAGADRFEGGDGNDSWSWFAKDVLSGTTHLGIDTIADFSDGDRLDLREFTKAFKGSQIDAVVHVTDSTQGSMMSVKIGSSFVDLVMLEGVHATSAGDMLADGMILS